MKKSSKTLNRDVEKIKKSLKKKDFKQRLGGSGFQPEFDVVGYGKASWDGTGIKTLEFELAFIFKAEYDFKYQIVWFVPVTVEISAELEAKLSGKAKFNFENKSISGELELALSFALKPFIGVGVSNVAAIGVLGKAQFEVDITLLSSIRSAGIDDVSLTGGLGLKAYIGPIKYEKYFREDTWHIYSRANGTSAQSLNNTQYSPGDLYDISNYSISTQAYTAEFANGSDSGTLISDIYLGAAPQIAAGSSATVMTYLTSDLERGAANQIKLMYSVYSNESDSWSEPAPVDSDATGDWTHTLRVVNGDIWLIYQNSGAVLADDADAAALADSYTVAAAKFNPEAGTFSEPICISGNDGYSFNPVLGEADGAPAAAWRNNENTDMFGLNSTNSIRYSTYTDGAWSEYIEISSAQNCVTDLAIGELDGKLCIAYITDSDNDLTTFDDRALYLYTDGNTTPISEGAVSSLYLGAFPSAGNALCWTENGVLYHITTANGEKAALFENTISGDYTVAGNTILFSGDESRIFAMKYEYGEWTMPVEVYSANGTVSAFAADEERLLAVDTVLSNDGEKITDNSNLDCVNYRKTNNVTLGYVDFNYEYVGSTVPLEVCIINNSMETLTAVDINIIDDSLNEVYSDTAICNIAPGDSSVLIINMPVETPDNRIQL